MLAVQLYKEKTKSLKKNLTNKAFRCTLILKIKIGHKWLDNVGHAQNVVMEH